MLAIKLCIPVASLRRYSGTLGNLRMISNLMKTTFSKIIILLLLASCNFGQKPSDQMVEDIREKISKETKISNERTIAWENLVDSLYKMADTNQNTFFLTIDYLMDNDGSLDRTKISDLHFIKGEIYYRIDSFKKALSEFTSSGKEISMVAPKVLAARAGAFLKLKLNDSAFTDLSKAAEINHYYLWNIGNYYEVVDNKDSAISCYDRLYNSDTIIYKFCLERVNELKRSKSKLLTELVFRDRERMAVLFK